MYKNSISTSHLLVLVQELYFNFTSPSAQEFCFNFTPSSSCTRILFQLHIFFFLYKNSFSTLHLFLVQEFCFNFTSFSCTKILFQLHIFFFLYKNSISSNFLFLVHEFSFNFTFSFPCTRKRKLEVEKEFLKMS